MATTRPQFDFCFINTKFWDDQFHQVWQVTIHQATLSKLGGKPVTIVVSYFHLPDVKRKEWSQIIESHMERGFSHFPDATP